MENTFQMVAKTFEGLEPVLRDELISLGADNVEMGCRMVSFEGDLELMYRANLCLRTALRVLKPIERFTASDPDDLYDIVREIPWEKYMTPATTFAIDATVNGSEFTHSRFATYRVKDGIVDHFRDLDGERPSIRVSGYDLLFNVHIDGDRVTISLDSSGEPLSKRGYREEQTEAPINEVLAAGIILTTGWRGDSNFLDPMCGSGTFLVEAALIAANINPGIYRKSFSFEKWPDFDADLFEELYNDDSAERPFDFKIYGGDIDPDAAAIALKNVRNAQVDNMVEVVCRPLNEWTDNPEPGILVTNPPYGHRLKPEDTTEFYKSIGQCLKRNFQGWTAWIIGPDNEYIDNIGLKPSIKIPLLNGSLECSLREYVMFDGKYNDFREGGGIIKGFEEEERRTREPKKMRRLTSDEWSESTTRSSNHKKPFRKDSRQEGGKPFRRDSDNDKKPFRQDNDRNSRPYRKEEGNSSMPYRKDDSRSGKPYRKGDGGNGKSYRKDGESDSRPPRKDGQKPFQKRGDRPFKGDGRRNDSGSRDWKEAAVIKPSGPKLSKDREVYNKSTNFRSRKQKPSDDK